MSKSRLVLAALVAQAAATQIILSPAVSPESCSNLPKCLGDIPIPRTPSGNGPTKSPPSLVIGVIVDPSRTADSRDPNCPSGRCIIVDPKELCDGTQPNCLPFTNIRQPSLPCKQKLPKCPKGGLLLDPESPCHFLDTRCPAGGVYVPTTPGSNFLPPWIIPCTKGEEGCSNGQKVVDAPKWPPPENNPIPGIPYDPTKICSAKTPGCVPGGVVVPWEPDDECDAREPGCLAVTIPSDPVDGTSDPACPAPNGHICRIINPVACHAGEPKPKGGCMKVDSIPCPLGSPGCHTGERIPPPVQPCVPKSNGCSDGGVKLSHPPSKDKKEPDDTVVPPGNQALIKDPKGKIKCSFKSVLVNAPHPPETITVSSPPLTITAACPTPKSSIKKKPTPPTPQPTPQPELPDESHVGYTPPVGVPHPEPSIIKPDSAPATPKTSIKKKPTPPKSTAPKSTAPKATPEPELPDESHVGYTPRVGVPYPSPSIIEPDSAPEFEEDIITETETVLRSSTRVRQKPAATPIVQEHVAPPPESVAKPAAPTPETVERVVTHTVTKEPTVQTSVPPAPTPETVKQTITETITHSATSSSTPAPVPTPAAPAKPLSKFACSTNDASPCVGSATTSWTSFELPHAAGSYQNPSPYNTQINNPESTDMILTVTDNIRKWEKFTVRLDGQVLGETSTTTLDWFADCGYNADSCIAQGWSHGYFKIPPGSHSLNIEWTGGGYWGGTAPYPDGRPMTYGAGQWRLSKSCTC